MKETTTVFEITDKGVREIETVVPMTIDEVERMEYEKYTNPPIIMTDYYNQVDKVRSDDRAVRWWQHQSHNHRKYVLWQQKYNEIMWVIQEALEANLNARITVAHITNAVNRAWYNEGFYTDSSIVPVKAGSDRSKALPVWLGGNAAKSPLVTLRAVGRIVASAKYLGVPVFTVSRRRHLGKTERCIRLNVEHNKFLAAADMYVD